MFTNQGSDQGCGKWLTTKNTRRNAQSLQQKNARGTKKGRKKQSVIKGDHLPEVVISSTPMSPRLVEMLSRVKQAKVERFFKPAGSKDREDKRSESEDSVRNDDGGLGKDVVQSYTTPILRRQHKLTTDQEELQLWGDDDDTTTNERLQNETDNLNISGVLPIEVSKSYLSADNDLQSLHHPNTTATNQHAPLINSSPDDTIKSPVSKRFKPMTDDSPTCPTSPFPSSFNNDDDDKDSDSFHYTQWVNEQKRKSKELQGDSPVNSHKGEMLESSGKSSSSSSTDLNKKNSQAISDENFPDTESEFGFSQWALEQKAKCKRLQDDSDNEILSDPRDKTESLHENLKETKSPNHLQSDLLWTESNFQYTEWVTEQKTKSKEIQHSSLESKKVPQTRKGKMIESLNENDVCIPESEVIEGVESGSENGWQQERKGSLEVESENLSKTDRLRSSNMNAFSRKAFKDVSNEVMFSSGTSSKTKRNELSEPCQKDTKDEWSNNMTSPSQESEYFRFTEWTRNQRQICKQIQKDPEVPSIQDEFWDIPTEKNDIKSRNEKLVLASDTDQESDTELF